MDAAERAEIVNELGNAFGSARDVTPAPGQPLHVLLEELKLASSWSPQPARALVVFNNWPTARPEFYIDPEVANGAGQSPKSNSTHYVLGESWMGYSWSFPWMEGTTATRAVEKWLARFTQAE
jgi:hypothetical protein